MFRKKKEQQKNYQQPRQQYQRRYEKKEPEAPATWTNPQGNRRTIVKVKFPFISKTIIKDKPIKKSAKPGTSPDLEARLQKIEDRQAALEKFFAQKQRERVERELGR